MINIDIAIKSKKWTQYFDCEENLEKNIRKICRDLIMICGDENLNIGNNNTEISISLVSNQQIKKFNTQYRNQDKVTNILSFPFNSSQELKELNSKKDAKQIIFLGDIIIAFEKIEQEAKLQNKDFKNHLTHLILHSILHLLGFKHDCDKKAEIMENLEIKILEKLNITNPYQQQ